MDVVLTILPEALRGFAQYRMVIYSLLLIILMITRPQGLLGKTAAFKGWRARLGSKPKTAVPKSALSDTNNATPDGAAGKGEAR